MTALLDNIQVSILPAANPDGFPRAHKGSCSGTRRREGERNAAEVTEKGCSSVNYEWQVSIETDFPILEDWTRFQHDLDFDPYLERQPETQVKGIFHIKVKPALTCMSGPDGLECGHPVDVGPPFAGVKQSRYLTQDSRMVRWG